MSWLDALILATVLILPRVACNMGYKRGVLDERKEQQKAQAIRLRYCQCDIHKSSE